MELYGNQDYFVESKYSIEQCKVKMADFSRGFDVESSFRLDNGTLITNLVFEKYSFRNGNFMSIFMNLVDDGQGTTKVFFAIKERQEGLVNFSFGKKEKLRRQIVEALTI